MGEGNDLREYLHTEFGIEQFRVIKQKPEDGKVDKEYRVYHKIVDNPNGQNKHLVILNECGDKEVIYLDFFSIGFEEGDDLARKERLFYVRIGEAVKETKRVSFDDLGSRLNKILENSSA